MGYIALVFDELFFYDKIVRQFKHLVPAYMDLIRRPHVTIAHSASEQELFKKYKDLKNVASISGVVRINKVVVTPRQCVLVVDVNFSEPVPGMKSFLHITLAVAAGVHPVESNKVVAASAYQGTKTPFVEIIDVEAITIFGTLQICF